MQHRLWVLIALILTTLAGIPANAAAGTTAVSAAVLTYDVPTIARVEVHEFDAPANPGRLSDARAGSASPSAEAHGTSTTQLALGVATNTADDVFHYTKGEFVESISSNGLRPGSYATPNGV